jgi:hypothetical protein
MSDKTPDDYYLGQLVLAGARWRAKLSPADVERDKRVEERYLAYRRKGKSERGFFAPSHVMRSRKPRSKT